LSCVQEGGGGGGGGGGRGGGGVDGGVGGGCFDGILSKAQISMRRVPDIDPNYATHSSKAARRRLVCLFVCLFVCLYVIFFFCVLRLRFPSPPPRRKFIRGRNVALGCRIQRLSLSLSLSLSFCFLLRTAFRKTHQLEEDFEVWFLLLPQSESDMTLEINV